MRKIFLGILVILLWQYNVVFAYQPPKEVALAIQFDHTDAYEQTHKQALHIKNLIRIDPNQKTNHIVGGISKIQKNFPVTMLLMVKSAELANGQISLEFNLLEYGFMQSPTLLMQPRMILKNGQAGEINAELFRLKVSANWTEQA